MHPHKIGEKMKTFISMVVTVSFFFGVPSLGFPEESDANRIHRKELPSTPEQMQGPSVPPVFIPTQPGKESPNPEEMRRQAERFQQEMEKRRIQEMGHHKQFSPLPAMPVGGSPELQKKIDVIVYAYQRGSLSGQEAAQDLYPLVKQEVEGKLQGLDEQVANLEKELEALKKAKSNPDLLVKKRIDELLGRATPEGMLMPEQKQ